MQNSSIKEYFIQNVYGKQQSFGNEMTKFENLMKVDCLKGKQLMQTGQQLIEYSRNGNYFKFSSFLATIINDPSINESFPFIYYLNKSLDGSLSSMHFMVASFLIDHGYPLNHHQLPNPLLVCLKNNCLNDDHCYEIIQFLSLKKFDLNQQVRDVFPMSVLIDFCLQEESTYFSPLHYAVQRQFLRCVQLLLELKADVNSVADKDVMPMTLAQSASTNQNKEEILRLLVERYLSHLLLLLLIMFGLMVSGAKVSWRSNKAVTFTGFACVDSTEIRVKTSDQSSLFSSQKVVYKSFSGGGSILKVRDENAIGFDQVSAMSAPIPTQTEGEIVVGISEDGCGIFSTGNSEF